MNVVKRVRLGRVACRGLVLLLAAVVLTSCGAWRGIANVPVPGGAGSAYRWCRPLCSPAKHLMVYVQMPETLALNVNSKVRVADVYVGTVKAIDLKNWTPTLTLDLEPSVDLPKNATAAIGQTSLLGSQHVELAPPTDYPASPEPLRSGDTIPLKTPQGQTETKAYPSTERVLAAFALILRGGGIPNLEVIQNEVYNIFNGRADQIRELIDRVDTFVTELNKQRDDLTRAIDSSDRLLTIVANRNDTLDRVLTEFPPLIKHFADTRDLFTNAVEALGRASVAANNALAPSSANLHTNLQNLQRPLKQLGRASPYLIGALKFLLTAPFNIENVPKVVRGDYINVSLLLDLTLSAIDNAGLSGTGVSGMLRALEQSWGRQPDTMIPDVRFTPNPHDVPGGPLVERDE